MQLIRNWKLEIGNCKKNKKAILQILLVMSPHLLVALTVTTKQLLIPIIYYLSFHINVLFFSFSFLQQVISRMNIEEVLYS